MSLLTSPDFQVGGILHEQETGFSPNRSLYEWAKAQTYYSILISALKDGASQRSVFQLFTRL